MMSRKMVSILCLLVAFIFIAGIFGACSSNSRNKGLTAAGTEGTTAIKSTTAGASETTKTAEKSSWEKDTSEFKFDWYVNISWWKWNGDYGNDMLSKMIKEKTGAVMNFIIPIGDGSQQLNAMMASNSLPDVVTLESWLDTKTKLAKSGAVYAYNDLIDQYCPDFWNIIYMDIFKWYEEADGKTYVLPNFAYSSYELKDGERLEPNTCFTWRKDIYEKLGKPTLNNAEDFLAILKRVKDEVKEYNGKPIIPFQLYEFSDATYGSLSLWWLAQYFGVPYENRYGNWLNYMQQPEFYQVIRFLNRAYNMGLISNDNFTDTRDMINEKVANGSVFAMATSTQDFLSQMKALYNFNDNARFEPFVLRSFDGKGPYLQDSRGWGWTASMITKNAKQPDRIVKLFHYLNSMEGQMDCNFGKVGVTYNRNDQGAVVWTDEYNNAVANGSAARKYGLGFNLMTDWLAVRDKFPKSTEPLDVYLDDIKKPMLKYSYNISPVFLKQDPTDPRMDEMKEIGNNINLDWGKQVIKMIFAKTEVECKAIYDETMKKYEGMGIEELNFFSNEGFQRAKKALGIERSWPGFTH